MKLKKVVTFEVDDKIAESIIKLNNKGYETAMCCSGHPDEKEIFTKEQLVDIAAKALDNWVDSLPKFENPYQRMEVI